eukprot:9128946-Pyramimonas_sp.AAC.1
MHMYKCPCTCAQPPARILTNKCTLTDAWSRIRAERYRACAAAGVDGRGAPQGQWRRCRASRPPTATGRPP